MTFCSFLWQFFRLSEAEGYVARSIRTKSRALQGASGGIAVEEDSADEN